MSTPELPEHWFRRELGRLVSILSHRFGVHRIELCEDAAQTALLQATRSWATQLPDNPGSVGAVVSHVAHDDAAWTIVVTVTIAAITLASWALRPQNRRLHGAAFGGVDLENPYSVQVVWDETMADSSADWLLATGDAARLAVIAGLGHCHHSAIPSRITRRTGLPVLAIAPILASQIGEPGFPTLQRYDLLLVLDHQGAPNVSPAQRRPERSAGTFWRRSAPAH